MHMDILKRRAVPLTLSLSYVVLVGSTTAISAPVDASLARGIPHALLLRGPVNAVDPANSRINVLGQWVAVAGSQVNSLPNEIVTIRGSVDSAGKYTVESVLPISSADQYVPGATSLFIKGRISSINYGMGTLQIGSLTVDYTGVLGSVSASQLTVGSVASFAGVEYTGNPEFYASSGGPQEVAPVSNPLKPFAQTGTGVFSLAQTGTGSHTLAQTGTGAFALAQTGTGKHSMAQTGTGSQALAQTGTGSHTMAQTGTGAFALAQTGTGSRVMAQTGTGVKAQ